MQLSEIVDEITPFLAMEVMERGMEMARGGASVVQLCVGEPGFPPPPAVIEETARAVAAGETHYTDSRGIRALREAIAVDCEQRRGVAIDPDQIVVTSGSSPALLMVLRMLLSEGDEIITPAPHYACYPNMVRVCGGRTVLVPTRPEDGFVLDLDRVRAAITARTRGILLASPANPTGAVQPPEVVRGLAELGVPILSDEIYDGLVYDDTVVTSPLGLLEDCFVFDGFSKRFAMTGFRLGFVIAPKPAMRALQSLQQNLFISTSHFAQSAGIAALKQGAAHVEMMRREYARRRKLLVTGLRELGFGVAVDPPGAFYVLAQAQHLGLDSLAVAHDLLERAHVAVAPGRDFGEIAEGFLRFSFATDYDDIKEALTRLRDVIS